MEGSITAADQRRLGFILRKEANASVFRLSTDILLIIFFFLRDSQPSARGQPWDWLTVTWICRRWRNVALGCPGLWCHIRVFRSTEKINAFFERSGEAEIKVDFRLGRDHDTALYASLLGGRMHRVREFSIFVTDSWDWFTPRLLEMSQSAKTMKLTYGYLSSSGGPPYAGNLRDIPDILPAIQLNSLTLNSVSLPWTCSLFRNLSALQISNNVGRKMILPTLSQLITVLECCPKLRLLTLDRVVCPSNFETCQEETRRLRLPILERLALIGVPYSFCSVFFNIVSANEYVRLDMSFFDDVFRTPTTLPPKLLNKRRKCQTISIELNCNSFSMRSNPSWDGVFPFSNTNISMRVHHFSKWSGTMAAIRAFLEDSYWKTADTVVISFAQSVPYLGEHMNNQSWIALLNGLPKLTRRLTIILRTGPEQYQWRERDRNIALLEALSNPVSETGVDAEAILPNLNQLTIYHRDFSSERGRERRDLFLEYIEKRNRNATIECRARFLECRWINTENECEIFAPALSNITPIGYGGVWDEKDA